MRRVEQQLVEHRERLGLEWLERLKRLKRLKRLEWGCQRVPGDHRRLAVAVG
ncbi:MAG TPA: hypothetical protein VFH80_03250 [Solirubrobacteraceae bacterium]|nr:hypothetical protein [Solirubrobacteraceae bacterium]